MKAIRPIGHEDRLSIVDHLDELRSRLFVCGGVMIVVFAFCFWQNQALIHALNRALPSETAVAHNAGLGAQARDATVVQHAFAHIAQGAEQLCSALVGVHGVGPGARQGCDNIAQGASQAAKILPKTLTQKEKPVTLGVGESFTTTLIVVGYFTLLISLPVILYELYAFVIPALNPHEKRVALPVMVIAPLLFIAGAVFTYFIVLPPAVHFLQGYNSEQFQILVQAKSYYKFEIFTMLGIGLAFQIPLVLLALQRIGVITASTLTGNWRYAVVLIAVAVAALPGVDPVTMMFETLPLVLLYAASIVMLKISERRMAKRQAAEMAAMGQGLDPM